MHADAICCLPQAQPVDDRAGVLEPLLPLLQVGQRRTGERVEGPLAGIAHVALHAARHAPPAKGFRPAMAARRRLCELGFNQGNDITGGTSRRQRRHQGVALCRCQRSEIGEQRPEILGLHDHLPPSASGGDHAPTLSQNRAEFIDNASIRRCFDELDITTPDVSVYLPRMAEAKSRDLLRVPKGYKLEASIRR